MGCRCYCIFEGGGAKGIAHIGALRALEDRRLDLVGFAGTSAGALVAALAAAGYSSSDLFGPGDSILDRLDRDKNNMDAATLVEPIRTPQRLLGSGWRAMRQASRAHLVLLGLVAAAFILPWALHVGGWKGHIAPIALMLVLIAGALIWAYQMAAGLASVEPVRDAINQALSLKLRGTRDRAPITFREFKERGGLPLRIVAANIDTGKLVLFSSEKTGDVAVADAVAASICIPLVFAPWKIGGDFHFDGGLVSNLPAWAFDAERARDRDAWTAAIEISDSEHKRPVGFGIVKAAALTAVFGRSILNTRSVERLRGIRVGVKLKLLDFNFSRERAAEIIRDAASQSELNLVGRIVDLPRQMQEVCLAIAGEARRHIDAARLQDDLPPLAGKVRVGVFRSVDEDPESLQNEFSAAFRNRTDERIRVPRSGTFFGEVLETGEPLYVANDDRVHWRKALPEPEDRWVRKMVWRDAKWLLCVPYQAGTVKELVVTVDSNASLELDDELIAVAFDSLSRQIETILERGLPKELKCNGAEGEEGEGDEQPSEAA